MSVINDALTDMAKKEENTSSTLKPADIPKTKRSGKLAWAVGGFALSLAIGGWAVSTQMGDVIEEQTISVPMPVAEELSADEKRISREQTASIEQKVVIETLPVDSPTSKLVSATEIAVYEVEPQKIDALPDSESKPQSTKSESPKKELSSASPEKAVAPVVAKSAKAKTEKTKTVSTAPSGKVKPVMVKPTAKVVTTSPAKTVVAEKPIEIAQVATKKTTPDVESGVMQVQHVELTPDQISAQAVERAKRALESNDLNRAVKEYEKAIKYKPADDYSRRKLAALYYGKKNLRKSVDVLRQGIRLDEDNQTLRIALSKILIREGQPEAALTPLAYLPQQPNIDYLSLRAGLAQQAKNTEIALESYQLLVEKEADNARWWLGLAIQQERVLKYKEAIQSYTQALGLIGVSNQSQAFIRDRLSLLKSLEGTESAD